MCCGSWTEVSREGGTVVLVFLLVFDVGQTERSEVAEQDLHRVDGQDIRDNEVALERGDAVHVIGKQGG